MAPAHARGGAEGRVEVVDEELHELARHPRVVRQRLLDVGLAQRHADLPDVLAVRPQHHHLMPFQLPGQDQAVEAVVLRFIVPDADERLLKFLLDRHQVVLHPLRGEAEIADADHLRRAKRLHFVRNLGLHLHAHVFQPRHDLRQRHGRAGVNDLEVELTLILPAMAIQIDVQRARSQHFFDVGDVVDRRRRRETFGVSHGERLLVSAVQLDARLLPFLLHQRFQKAIAPRARRLGEIRFDALDVDVRNPARRRADDEQSARQRRIRHVVVDRGVSAVERLLQNLLRSLLEIGGVAIARNEDEAGDESLEHVFAGEERDALPFLQQQDSPGDLEEVSVGDLEELVAREGLQDLHQCFSVVTARIETGAIDRPLRFQPEHGDLAHAPAVRSRREETQEAILGDQVPLIVVALDADAIHGHGTVDHAAVVRLGDDEQIFAPRVRAEFRRERLIAALH